MKELKILLKDFSEMFSYSLCMVCVVLSGFIIFINLYHYKEIGYEVSNEYVTTEEYNKNKIKITNLKNKVNNVKETGIKQSDYFIYSQTKLKLDACLTALQESSFYNMKDQHVSSKNLYDYNNELSTSLQYKCLFEVDYIITSQIKEYNSSINYNLTENIESTRKDLMFYGDSLKNQLLANGSYHYSTSNSKISIYNQKLNYYNLTINNYNKLLNETEVLVNWFVNEFGR